MSIENIRHINAAQLYYPQQILQQKDTKISQCFEIKKNEPSAESSFFFKIITHFLPKLDSPIRSQIVKLMESKNGRVISNEEFEKLKIKFRSHPDGSIWLAQLKQAVGERNQEIRHAGVCRVACHTIAVWLRQSLTGQAESLIFQIATENPSLHKISKEIKTSNVHYLPILEKDKVIPINEETFSTYLKTQGFKTQEKITESQLSAEHDKMIQRKQQVFEIEDKCELAKVDVERPKEESQAYRFLKQAEERRVKKEKAKKIIPVATIDEPMVNNRLTLDKDRYDGERKNSLPHGMGRLQCSNGDVFEGEFKKGKFVKGKHIKVSGMTLEGEFVDNLLKGWGTMTTDGKVTEGEFIYGNLDFKSIPNAVQKLEF